MRLPVAQVELAEGDDLVAGVSDRERRLPVPVTGQSSFPLATSVSPTIRPAARAPSRLVVSIPASSATKHADIASSRSNRLPTRSPHAPTESSLLTTRPVASPAWMRSAHSQGRHVLRLQLRGKRSPASNHGARTPP